MGKLVALLVPLVAIVLMFRINSIFSGRSLKGKSKPLRNDEVDVALHRLADAAGVEHVRVRVLEEEVVNGLVTPGGDIYVTRGLLDQYRRGSISLAEFTSVIAHE
ncbi:MAG: M48 family metalloprotease, partial [Pseudomonadota bacterium]